MKTSSQALKLNKEPPPLDGEFPDEDEIKASELGMQAYMDEFNRLLESDEKLKAAFEEIKRLCFRTSQLEVRIYNVMSEKNTYVKQIKQLQREADRLKKIQRMNLVKP